MSDFHPLRLIAEDKDDLAIVSAAVQDAVCKAGNIKYDSRRRRFSIELNRYRWEAEPSNGERQRVRALLAIDSVLSVKTRAVNKADPDLVMAVLQIDFDPEDEPPGGEVTILFAGDGELKLRVEALDMTLLDSDLAWPTKHEPNHERRR